ncbi:MAG: bifunctional 4-hydroxy-2-oxoglutarate aldolase/2-dehydro-3-deoxy-phosphogluconate aldolase [Lachnospiraceae bacterium]|jgi:2-dehydro-3-deoxyphosphogluconate aldolase/(4S)-4-hydroxy-2-oxoglutarate aldolase|nr:bifunctional 4-hydroxy-2-oxoglutarate aldolase/2-dehydro-3-deoxy-phosphogluconate aldolase [Lachnospiraceae bacterium]
MDVLEQIGRLRIVPVVVLESADDALPLARALCNGGLPCAEVTFRTAAAAASIRAMTEAFPHMLVGAGTVLSPAQVDEAIAAGARFIVSPGLNPHVVEHCQAKDILVIPGIVTPTEIEQALGLGLSVVKFFPAEAFGGLATIKALAAPYGMVRFVPTGGVSAANVRAYLDYDRVLACGGSWMVESEMIKAGNFARIEELTREAVSLIPLS